MRRVDCFFEVERWTLKEVDVGVLTGSKNLERPVSLEGYRESVRGVSIKVLVDLLQLRIDGFSDPAY